MKNFTPHHFYINNAVRKLEPKQNNKSRRSGEGLTLIEILIVIGILAILAISSFAAFRAYQPTLKLSGSVQELTGNLRYAEQLAVTEQIEYGIQFFPAENKYEIVKLGPSPEVITTVNLSSGISFDQVVFTDDLVKFNPYGAAEEAGQVTLINTNNSTTIIEVRASGFVKVVK